MLALLVIQMKNSTKNLFVVNLVAPEKQVKNLMQPEGAILLYYESIHSKKNWNTKEDKGKSMVSILYVCNWQKGMSQCQTLGSF